MQTLKDLKAISKRNFLQGIIHCVFTCPILFYLLVLVRSIDNENSKPYSFYALELLNSYLVCAFIVLVVLNTLVDFMVYKDLSKYKIKILLFLFNLLYIVVWSLKDINNSEPLMFYLLMTAFFLYKVYKYYSYYRLCKHYKSEMMI